ncbi:hypothetical protein QE454_002712 [Microbacterium sp. SORGH_AS454]|nr:hypothetical protein [Microbacterium sp. SORGH_AS_0454]
MSSTRKGHATENCSSTASDQKCWSGETSETAK